MSLASLAKIVVLEAASALAPLIIKEAKSRLKKKAADLGIDLDDATEALLQAELVMLGVALSGVVSAFEPPSKPLGLDEPLTTGMDVELVEPTGDEPTFKPNANKDGE